MESKKDIRKRILSARASLLQHEQKEKSFAIYKKATSHPFFLDADCIFCYVDYNSEVETSMLIETSWKSNKKVAVPKIDGNVMNFYYINSFSDLNVGYRGILEPKPDFPAKDKHALVIMPGVAFDKNRHRIGYGKGFYDNFLQEHAGRTIAFAYELQIIDSVPANNYDICPDILITEDTIYE